MGARIGVRADTAIAGSAGARREWPGLWQIPVLVPGATTGDGLCRARLRAASRCSPR